MLRQPTIPVIFVLSMLVAACSKPQPPAVPATAADTASPVAIESIAVPSPQAVTPAPAKAAGATPAAAFVPLKVPVEDTQEPASLDAARLPNGATLPKSAPQKNK